jgi:hypothetical protein
MEDAAGAVLTLAVARSVELFLFFRWAHHREAKGIKLSMRLLYLFTVVFLAFSAFFFVQFLTYVQSG